MIELQTRLPSWLRAIKQTAGSYKKLDGASVSLISAATEVIQCTSPGSSTGIGLNKDARGYQVAAFHVCVRLQNF